MRRVSWFQAGFDLDWSILRDYITAQEVFVARSLEEFDAKVKEEALKLSEGDRDELLDFYNDEGWVLSEKHPPILWYSCFVACYSVLEHTLQRLCNTLKPKNQCFEVSDLKGDIPSQAKSYLKKVAGVDFPDETTEWGKIRVYQRIRNKIVHQGGTLDKKEQKNIKEALRGIKGGSSILVDCHGQILICPDCCRELLDTLRDFFKELFNRCGA